MQRTGSLEKTLMLGKIEGRRRKGRQRMRWLDGIADSVHEFEQAPGVGDGQAGMLLSIGSQRHDWVIELNWSPLISRLSSIQLIQLLILIFLLFLIYREMCHGSNGALANWSLQAFFFFFIDFCCFVSFVSSYLLTFLHIMNHVQRNSYALRTCFLLKFFSFIILIFFLAVLGLCCGAWVSHCGGSSCCGL